MKRPITQAYVFNNLRPKIWHQVNCNSGYELSDQVWDEVASLVKGTVDQVMEQVRVKIWTIKKAVK